MAAPLACTSPLADQPADAGAPTPLGNGKRIRDVMNPTSAPKSGASVTITGASFLWVDTFDETNDGKSAGTVYLQDTGSTAAYSGASLYQPTYIPANLAPAPGDVLDLVGTYQAETSIGAATFNQGEALIQISKPQVTFRFEYLVPPAAVINVTDLNDYAKGQQWQAMLVTVNDVTLGSGFQNVNGRVTAYLTSTISGSSVEMSNELFDLSAWNAKAATKVTTGTKLKSLTGIVTWFTQYHIAPRSAADIVLE